MRGLKRKLGNSQENEDKLEYKQNLSQFQTIARQRESIRLKNHCLLMPNSSDSGYWERLLSDKIHVETQMIRGTANFLKACKTEEQTLEAAKRLHLGKLRLDMLKYELNKLKRGRGGGSPFTDMTSMRPSYAGVSISDIRIPLMWKRKDHLKDMGDNRKFAVFCLARIGSQIYDSALISPVDRGQTDINLQDVFLFNKVSAHFEVIVEVYSKLVSSSTSTSSLVKEAETILGKTPQKIVRSISKAVGRKLLLHNSRFSNNESTSKCEQLSDSIFNAGPKFELIASANLSLDQCSDDVETHELYVEDRNSDNCPPMFGAICCRLAALPYCCEEPILSGKLIVQREEAGDQSKDESRNTVVDFSKPRSAFAQLMDWKISIWTTREQKESARRPVVTIPINRDTCILLEKRDSDIEEITVTNADVYESTTWRITFDEDSKENQHQWTTALMQHSADHRRWKNAATKKFHLGSLADIESFDANNAHGGAKSPKRPRYTKSFKRTRSKLVMLYNQAGSESTADELV